MFNSTAPAAQVLLAAVCQVVYRGALLSAQFIVGGRHAGQLRGLYPGWILGRQMVRICNLLISKHHSRSAVHVETTEFEGSRYLYPDVDFLQLNW